MTRPTFDDKKASRPTISPGEIREILPAFGLQGASSVRSFEPGAASAAMALIEHGENIYLLKRRPRASGWVDHDLIVNEHDVQARLAADGVPVALPAARVAGGLPTVHSTSGFVYELFAHIEGSPAHPTERHARTAGETLGRIHASRAVSVALRDARSGAHLPEGVGLDEVFERGPLDHPALARTIESLEHDFTASLRACEDREPPRLALLHGDYHPANLLWSGDRLASVIDFEATGRGDPAGELASGALFFALDTRADSPDAWPEAPDTPRLAAFLRGYAGCDDAPGVGTGIVPDDLPWLMIQQLVWQTLPRLYGGRGFGAHLAADVVPFVARTCAWIRDHADGLALVIADELAAGPDDRPSDGSRPA